MVNRKIQSDRKRKPKSKKDKEKAKPRQTERKPKPKPKQTERQTDRDYSSAQLFSAPVEAISCLSPVTNGSEFVANMTYCSALICKHGGTEDQYIFIKWVLLLHLRYLRCDGVNLIRLIGVYIFFLRVS